jgi:Domain of unknown function (DUF4251)
MKTMTFKQLSLFLATGLFLTLQNINAQDIKLSRQDRKEVMKAQREANFHTLDSLLNSKSFVLEADFLRNRNGVPIPVVSTLNFIKVDNSEGVLQTGSDSGFGYNGVGGVTAQGSIGRWTVSRDSKKLTYTVDFSILTNLGNYDVVIFVSSDNHASATITGMWPGRLTWDGKLYSITGSRIFKGQDTI